MTRYLLVVTLLFFSLNLYSSEQKRVIITGGPGAGKTTILLGMEQRGYDIVTEAASDVIKMELAKSVKEPWDQEWFQQKVLDLQTLREKRSLSSNKPFIFYDRAPFDTMTYHKLKWPQSEREFLDQALQQLKSNDFYYPIVFLVENFGECLNNEVRHESMCEALKIQEEIIRDYEKNGFQVVRVPPDKPEKRIKQILETLTKSDRNNLNSLSSEAMMALTD